MESDDLDFGTKNAYIKNTKLKQYVKRRRFYEKKLKKIKKKIFFFTKI